MSAKMPYLKEDEITINAKTATTATSNSSASDVDDAEESLFENKAQELQSTEEDNDDDEATNSSVSSYASTDSPSRKRKHFDPDAVIATALNYLSTNEPARDELWQFMSYLHTVLKNLPPHLQLELKNKIQRAMYEVEKQDLEKSSDLTADKDVVPDQ
ncbi:uncharacterized protein LOC116338032 [Contarinia nasturtii]|uniref:uncharacterized protein LOC116338032 n=1 Tax=Contarinia nasturtii TaxID=265458 RepID=UPI0012D43E8B|nr:uncharacterized protein LOC116338032 [Contarinia nasturtii]